MSWRNTFACSAALGLALALGGCAGGNNGGNKTTTTTTQTTSGQTGSVSLMVSDDSSDDWATVGVHVLSVALIPQGGGTPVTIYTAPSPAPVLNLAELDQIDEILGNVSVPQGTYDKAVMTVSANPADILLTASQDPESGFPCAPGATVPASQIVVQGATGSAGSRTVAVTLKLQAPLVISTGSSAPLDLEFDLAHPAFIVDHTFQGSTMWAVNFNAALRHRPIHRIERVVLRDLYGSATGVSSDNTTLTITKVHPVLPPTNPETATAGTHSLQILADATNGTIFYDLDVKTRTIIKNFSTLAGNINGKYVRVAARFQQNGTLVAVRVWASSSFQSVWLNPEGHVLHVDTTGNTLTVLNDSGQPVTLSVDSNTQFYFRVPDNAIADATPIGTGPTFLPNLVRGFKVHVSVVDPLASTLVAQTVDIEIAKFDGTISAPTSTSFVDTRNFVHTADNYTVTLPYISATTPNGTDGSGNQVTGFKWWYFAFPTLVDTGATAVSDFVNATNDSVNFGGTVGALPVWGASAATWADTANPTGWAARWTIIAPTPVPLGTVGSQFVTTSSGGAFGLNVPGGTNTVTVNLSNVSGSATLVYQVDRSGMMVTVTPQDLTNPTVFSNVASHLINGTPVKVFGVPQADHTIKAYVVFYYTGSMPS